MKYRNKVIKLVVLLLIAGALTAAIIVLSFVQLNGFEQLLDGCKELAGVFLGAALPFLLFSFQDVFLDRASWKSSQRGLKRGGFIKRDTTIRISFSYLFRIMIDGHYLLVKNPRTYKYQPVGGVYKFDKNEKNELKNLFHIQEDDRIKHTQSSKNDYRLKLQNKHLRRFVRRFDSKKAQRENIFNLSREFKEELVKPGILNWKRISYRICGRHFAGVKYSEHFQIYELLLADIVEIVPSDDQEKELRALTEKKDDRYMIATEKQIESLGVDFDKEDQRDIIGDHTKKILEKTEDELVKIKGTGKTVVIDL